MNIEKINPNQPVPIDVPYEDIKKEKAEEIPVHPRVLSDQLKVKRDLINLLEKGGFFKEKDWSEVKAEIDRALADLDKIIDLCPERK